MIIKASLSTLSILALPGFLGENSGCHFGPGYFSPEVLKSAPEHFSDTFSLRTGDRG
jgi:hypothetical protein